jgi:peptidoglycan L-alanyl-D-glutamate endopeptidase CwlK
MINSRKIEDLDPQVQQKCKDFVVACKKADIDVSITATYRDKEYQDSLYAQGRTAPGKIVTNAKGGQSMHNFRVAFDFVPITNGKADWQSIALFDKCGIIGKTLGLEWGGDFKSLKDRPHFQYTNGLTLSDFQKGKKL